MNIQLISILFFVCAGAVLAKLSVVDAGSEIQQARILYASMMEVFNQQMKLRSGSIQSKVIQERVRMTIDYKLGGLQDKGVDLQQFSEQVKQSPLLDKKEIRKEDIIYIKQLFQDMESEIVALMENLLISGAPHAESLGQEEISNVMKVAQTFLDEVANKTKAKVQTEKSGKVLEFAEFWIDIRFKYQNEFSLHFTQAFKALSQKSGN